jgi:hypothetical protein
MIGVFVSCYNVPVVNKHFFKTLVMFTGMIIVGLLGIFLVSYFDEQKAGGGGEVSADSMNEVAN